MRPPTIFTQHGVIIATVNRPSEGRCLPQHVKEKLALIIARHYAKHNYAIESIILHGLASDTAEADELTRSIAPTQSST